MQLRLSLTTCLKLAGFVVTVTMAKGVNATVLTFDDLPNPPISLPYALIPIGYGGLTWNNFYYLNSTTYPTVPSSYPNGTVSGTNVAFNGGGLTAVAGGTLFDFNGAYFTGAWNNGLNISVNGYVGNNLLYSSVVAVNSTGPTWFDFNYLGVDSVSFSSYGGVPAGYTGGAGTQFVMDNFTFNAPVPIPATVWLFGSGILGLLGVAKTQNRMINFASPNRDDGLVLSAVFW